MKSTINEFRILGICYGDAKKIYINGNYYTEVIVAIPNQRKGVCHIPVISGRGLEELLFLKCRNNNRVAIEGSLSSTERMNRETGETIITVYFVATSIMLISKPQVQSVSGTRLNAILSTHTLDKYTPPVNQENELQRVTAKNLSAEREDEE